MYPSPPISQGGPDDVETTAEVGKLEFESVWAEVTTEDGQIYYHNTVTDETRWTHPGTAVKETLLSTYGEDEINAWARAWSETEGRIPKGLKKACKQLEIKKDDVEEWLKREAHVNKQASKVTSPQSGMLSRESPRRRQTMDMTTIRAQLGTAAPMGLFARTAGGTKRSAEI